MNHKALISIDFPLKGTWRFLRPPGHHPYAFDFVQTDSRRQKYFSANKFRIILSNVPVDKYYCWNKKIYAPISGKIIRVGTDWNDNLKTNIWKSIKLWYNATYRFKPKELNGRLDIRPNAGNYIMIKSNKGYIVFLAHLKKGSILVKEGQWVKSGDHVGNVGNSGNSTAPHLHINLFDQIENPYTSKILPFVFKKFQILDKNNEWKPRTLCVPKVKSFVKHEG